MKAFEELAPGMSWDQVRAHFQRVREYIQHSADPNETGEDGQTLLLLALSFSSTDEGEDLVTGLLDRGANPNKPSSWAIFTKALSVSNSLALVTKLIQNGLCLNEVYEVSYAKGGVTDGPSTLLDHLYGIRDYIAPKRKKLGAITKKYAGGLGKRRRFIDETIALLESRGAKRAVELQST
jgi:hypothetical protein